MALGVGEHNDSFYSWKTVSNDFLTLPEPSTRKIEQWRRRKRIPMLVLMGVFEVYRECEKRLTKASINGIKTIPINTAKHSGKKIIVKEMISRALREKDYKKADFLKMICYLYQAEEMINVYTELMMALVGCVPLDYENFVQWLKRAVGEKKAQIKGKGKGRYVRLNR